MTPFADIVLLSFNSATAIVIQVLYAIFFFNEVFICKFDLPALFLIILGSIMIILTANFSLVQYDVDSLKHHLASVQSSAFFAFTVILVNLTFYLVKR